MAHWNLYQSYPKPSISPRSSKWPISLPFLLKLDLLPLAAVYFHASCPWMTLVHVDCQHCYKRHCSKFVTVSCIKELKFVQKFKPTESCDVEPSPRGLNGSKLKSNASICLDSSATQLSFQLALPLKKITSVVQTQSTLKSEGPYEEDH